MRKYRTIQGDTWDMIAFREYQGLGGERMTGMLLDANPQYSETVIFPAGIVLDVPEADIPRADTLPPWVE